MKELEGLSDYQYGLQKKWSIIDALLVVVDTERMNLKLVQHSVLELYCSGADIHIDSRVH